MQHHQCLGGIGGSITRTWGSTCGNSSRRGPFLSSKPSFSITTSTLRSPEASSTIKSTINNNTNILTVVTRPSFTSLATNMLKSTYVFLVGELATTVGTLDVTFYFFTTTGVHIEEARHSNSQST